MLGLSSGAQAIDLALSLALTAPRPGGPLFDPCDSEPPPPMSVVLLRGSFHGNCTRAAFSSSAVFRAHAQRETLCEFTAIYIEPDADAAAVDAAFAAHDAGGTAIVAVIVEPQQHFAAFAQLASPTAAALGAAAARRGMPVVCDEIWSGVHRTGGFLACVGWAAARCGRARKGAVRGRREAGGPPIARWLRPRRDSRDQGGRALRRRLRRCRRVPARRAARARRRARAKESSAPSASCRAHSGRLLPVRGRGFSYEVELRATAELAAAGWRRAASVATALALLHALWWGGALVLPPLRAPRPSTVSSRSTSLMMSCVGSSARSTAPPASPPRCASRCCPCRARERGVGRCRAASARRRRRRRGPPPPTGRCGAAPGLPRVAAAAAAAGRQRYLLDDGGHLPEYDEAAGELLAPAGGGGLPTRAPPTRRW